MSDASNTPTSPSCPTCTFLTLHPKDPAKKRAPRVEELLRQNHPPLDVELADFRLVLDKSPEILQDLDAKIAQATETLNHLKEARMAAESHLEDAKALIHPIRSIPNEVLAEIFMHSIPSWETGGVVVDSLNPNTPPWTLTHVCRRWRELAISLPQIWAYIYLDFDRHAKHITPVSAHIRLAFISDGLGTFPCLSSYTVGPMQSQIV
ncbi:hypothetical protein BDZ89DRAFT_1030747 [Hymenopellis radicata]|nr:hypothetical protein BDZ89DRAFT_1030747 [Hymenopellis radicata]